MKHLTVLFIVSWLFTSGKHLQGQSIADFTITDINGNPHSLYSTLNSGKTVVLAFFSSQSHASKVYHNSLALKSLYQSHGPAPAGDERVEIFYIEGDPSTPPGCLNGSCSSGNYNWISGVSFPVFENSALATQLGVFSFPSIYIVCPDKKAKPIPALAANPLWEIARECPVLYGQYNIGIYDFDPGSPYEEICGTTTLKPTFRLVNVGTQPISEAVVTVRWNDSLNDTIHWVGQLNTFEEVELEAKPITTSNSGTMTLTALLSNQSDENLTNNTRTKEFATAKVFTDSTIRVRLRSDEYGFETYWDVRDKWGNILKKGGNPVVGPNGGGIIIDPNVNYPEALGSETVYSWFCTFSTNGCYSFTLADAFGDGFLCPDQNPECAYYRLFNYSNSLTPVLYGTEFHSYKRHIFGVEAPGLPSAASQAMDVEQVRKLYPNPTEQEVFVEFDVPSAQPVQIELYNAQGKLMQLIPGKEMNSGPQTVAISTETLPDGLYFILLSGRDFIRNGSFIRQKKY